VESNISGDAPYFVKIDNVKLFIGDTMKEPALFIQKDDFKRFELFSELSCCDVGINIKYLSFGALGQTGKNRQCAGSDGCLKRTFVNARDFADETVLLTVEVVRGEDARSDRPSPRAKLLQRGDDLQIFVQKYTASNL
jgi:hypothetical protein